MFAQSFAQQNVDIEVGRVAEMQLKHQHLAVRASDEHQIAQTGNPGQWKLTERQLQLSAQHSQRAREHALIQLFVVHLHESNETQKWVEKENNWI